jgi:hypothetical protein
VTSGGGPFALTATLLCSDCELDNDLEVLTEPISESLILLAFVNGIGKRDFWEADEDWSLILLSVDGDFAFVVEDLLAVAIIFDIVLVLDFGLRAGSPSRLSRDCEKSADFVDAEVLFFTIC